MNDNVKQLKPANLDQYQMDNMSFDSDKQAWRVSVVDGVTLNVDTLNLPEGKTSGEIQVINVPTIIKEQEIHQINYPVIIKEFQTIDKPVIIKEIEYKIVEIPVLVPEVKIVEIEKPVIIKETVFKELPMFVKVCIVMQALASIGLLITHMKGY